MFKSNHTLSGRNLLFIQSMTKNPHFGLYKCGANMSLALNIEFLLSSKKYNSVQVSQGLPIIMSQNSAAIIYTSYRKLLQIKG